VKTYFSIFGVKDSEHGESNEELHFHPHFNFIIKILMYIILSLKQVKDVHNLSEFGVGCLQLVTEFCGL